MKKEGIFSLSYINVKLSITFFFILFGMVIFSESALAFSYSFSSNETLQEASPMSSSTSPYWWLNSGAYLKIYGGRGHTNEGDLPINNYWRNLYSQTNPVDTDDGYHPQNIFRLILKDQWQNIRQEAYFKIVQDNFSPSSNRKESNGLFLFNRYLDGNNVYYTGVRVDGAAVIKKKKNGQYYTLAYIPKIYPGIYDRNTNPSLLPKSVWIGLQSELTNNLDGSINIKLYIDKGWRGIWTLVANINDTQNTITQAGYAGIRTDFMDVIFDNYKANNI